MQFLADIDNQTKLIHVGYSILGMLIAMVVLVKFKPTIMPRMITAFLLGLLLVYCLSGPITGDQEKVKSLANVGWLAVGLLFGIGRGEFVIEYLIRKVCGAPDQILDQVARSEEECKRLEEAEAINSVVSGTRPESQSAVSTGAIHNAEAKPGEVKNKTESET